MRTKVKTFFAVVGVLVIVSAISLIIISRGPLYGQGQNDNWVPDLTGEWTAEMAGYSYEDVTLSDPTDPDFGPDYIEGIANIQITHQNGRVFAGTWDEGPDNIKIAGVMLPDRTVSVQDFTPSEQRNFFTGRLTKSGGTLQMSGYLHSFDDFNHIHNVRNGDRSMASLYVQLTKIE